MKRLVLAAALLAMASFQPAVAASGGCYTQAAMEADQAIRFLTDLMVAASTCQDRTYAEFRLRNKDPIIAYQKTLIAHFHSTAKFDAWNTTLANELSLRQNQMPNNQICVRAAALFEKARALDAAAYRTLAASLAQAASTQYHKCGK
jgi:hypothetical protein